MSTVVHLAYGHGLRCGAAMPRNPERFARTTRPADVTCGRCRQLFAMDQRAGRGAAVANGGTGG